MKARKRARREAAPAAAPSAALGDALAQQTATAEILNLIAASPGDVQPVFDAIAERAARLCDASDARVVRTDGGQLRLVACFGDVPHPSGRALPIARTTVSGRAIIDRTPTHVHDLAAAADEYPDAHGLREQFGTCTILAVPLLRRDTALGAIVIARAREVRPFADRQIALLQTFADQAVIAIENARLLNELGARNAALTESLEQQTATADILKVISASPTDVRPVLETVVTAAARFCGAPDVVLLQVEDGVLRGAAGTGTFPQHLAALTGDFKTLQIPLTRESVSGRAACEQRMIHVHDLAAQPETEFPVGRALQRRFGHRTMVSTPLLSHGRTIGVLSLFRTEVSPFARKQLQLLQTFADQAVIAIENARLFTALQTRNAELTEALAQQTATSEVLKAISRSSFDLDAVLQTLIENATRLIGADHGFILRPDGEHYRPAAWFNAPRGYIEYMREHPPSAGRGSVVGRALLGRRTVHIVDVLADPEYTFTEAQRIAGYRTCLVVPMLRGDALIGLIGLWRTEVQAFTDKQIELVRTFADQGVIAIENVRLFTELQARNAALTESLEQQTATSEILRVISSSPTDLRPVIETVVQSASRLCDAADSQMLLLEGDRLRVLASSSEWPTGVTDALPVVRGLVTGHALLERRTIHVHDLAASAADYPEAALIQVRTGQRTTLATPLLREGVPIGVLLLRRFEVRPFTDGQIALLETFATQSVIAIENVRLFTELQSRNADLSDALDRQTATAEILKVISASPTDVQPVFEAIIASAVRLCDGWRGSVYRFENGLIHWIAGHNTPDDFRGMFPLPVTDNPLVAHVIATGTVIQVPDALSDPRMTDRYLALAQTHGFRSLLMVPLKREGTTIGAITVARQQTGAFPEAQVTLLQTFAEQAVIAVENARLVSELQEKTRQLEIADRHKSEFLANMSHELRTPLNAVIGFSEVLLERMFGEINDKQAEYLRDIHDSGRHLLSLINDILDLSKIEAGRMELELSTFDVPTALHNALTLVRTRADHRSVMLESAVDPGLGDFAGDERKLKQILLNLLTNAVKFTPAGGRVTVRAARTGDAVEISVADTGVGIAAEDQEAIFEEFRQVGGDHDAKREGTGLGLTLTRKFVELHGGRIAVKSVPGQGSTFTVTLPVR